MMQLTPYRHALNAEIVLTTRFKGIISFKNRKGGESVAQERIHNPKTHSDSRIRQRTTKNGHKGQIMGPYHNSKKK